MGRGVITLYSWFSEPLKRDNYYCARDRYEILVRWGAMYGPKFNDCYVILQPDLGKSHVLKNGKNSKSAFDFNHQENEQEEPTIRTLIESYKLK